MHAMLQEKFELVINEADADIIILNTCTVKGPTENKIIERIKKLVKEKRKFVIAGCLTVNQKKLRNYAPNAPMLSPSAIRHICEAVDAASIDSPAVYNSVSKHMTIDPKLATVPISRIPVNDGCTSNCFFCQTKLARPVLRSYSPKTIVKWINESVCAGAREMQLTSMDLGAYGLDIKTNLISLLNAIIEDNSSTKTGHEFYVRLGMINPNHAKRILHELLEVLKHPKFYKFLHIPVQTGSEKVCKEMNRDHTVQDFVDIVEYARKQIPEITIATDVIVGYPTETEDDFKQTKVLLKQIKPDIINISKFSPRAGTKAKELKQLHNDTIKKRSREISLLVKDILIEKRKALIGKKYAVLITEKQKDFTGRNMNYIQVVVKGFKGQLGEFINVEIIDANHGCLFGKIRDSNMWD